MHSGERILRIYSNYSNGMNYRRSYGRGNAGKVIGEVIEGSSE
jgi:hypothetical protein